MALFLALFRSQSTLFYSIFSPFSFSLIPYPTALIKIYIMYFCGILTCDFPFASGDIFLFSPFARFGQNGFRFLSDVIFWIFFSTIFHPNIGHFTPSSPLVPSMHPYYFAHQSSFSSYKHIVTLSFLLLSSLPKEPKLSILSSCYQYLLHTHILYLGARKIIFFLNNSFIIFLYIVYKHHF